MGLLYTLFKADAMRQRIANAPASMGEHPLGIKALFKNVYGRGYQSPVTGDLWQFGKLMARPAEDDGHFGIDMARAGSPRAYDVLEFYLSQGCVPVLLLPSEPYDLYTNAITAYGLVTILQEL